MSWLDTSLHVDLKEKRKHFRLHAVAGDSSPWGHAGLESFENITTEARVTSLNDPLFPLAKKSKQVLLLYMWVFQRESGSFLTVQFPDVYV